MVRTLLNVKVLDVKASIRSPLGTSTPRTIEKSGSKKRKRLTPTPTNQVNKSNGNNGTASNTTHIRRQKYETKALKEIRFFQNIPNLLIPRKQFSRLVREIMAQFTTPDYRIQARALDALHESTEAFVVRYLEESNLCAIHAKRITLMPKDMQLLKKIKQCPQSQSITN